MSSSDSDSDEFFDAKDSWASPADKRSSLVRRFASWRLLILTLYRMVMPIGTPFLKEKINN